ncbi:MAG: exopolyphosphatase, partial [Gammaproteobacteria bacterium]
RLAVVVHRSRNPNLPPQIQLEGDAKTIALRFPEGWMEAHPLTQADLEQEADYLKADGYTLTIT